MLDQAQGMVESARPKVQETINRAQDQLSRRGKQPPYPGSEDAT
jgi:uncharacterized protein YjbJ (UPF0337 family)